MNWIFPLIMQVNQRCWIVFKGRQTYYSTGPERLQLVKGFNLEQCKAALKVEAVQKTAEKALNSRIKKLAVKGHE